MQKYLVETTHTFEDCADVIGQFAHYGYITHFEWGCKAGEHKGWAIIEAENKEEAMMVVPSMLRNKSRVVGLNTFSPEEIQKMHKGS
jgi:hypothetical protein